MITVTREHVIVAANRVHGGWYSHLDASRNSILKGTNQTIPIAVCLAVQQNGACVGVACEACMVDGTGAFGVTFKTLEQICKRFDVQFDLKGDSNA